ncbi:MAG: hypothetical protein HWN80_07210 [Candidatus Lokiarchaeota archaeon]|nr:hypothetical protein [Candidatus Lokiarchaeota archaeon]
MAWGGSLNKEGSNHFRNLREADKVIKYLESLKRELIDKEKQKVSETINIIIKHYTKESKSESLD